MVQLVHKGQPDQPGLMESQERRVLPAPLVTMVSQEQPAQQATLVQLVRMASPEQPERQDQRVPMAL